MKNVIIIAIDANYIQHAKYNINNIRHFVEELDIVILHDRKNSDKIKLELKNFNVIFHSVDALKINEGAFYIKYYLFDTFFKQWENILYIDCDTMISSDIKFLFDLLNEDNRIFVDHERCEVLKFFTSGCPMNQENQQIYSNLLKEDSIFSQGFNSGILLYKSSLIEEDTVQKLHNLHEKYIKINKHVESGTDQPIINLLFAKISKQVPENYFSFFGDMTDKTIIIHFCRWYAPWINDQYNQKINMRYIDYYNKMSKNE